MLDTFKATAGIFWLALCTGIYGCCVRGFLLVAKIDYIRSSSTGTVERLSLGIRKHLANVASRELWDVLPG